MTLSNWEAITVIATAGGAFFLWVTSKLIKMIRLLDKINSITQKELTTNGGESIKDVSNDVAATNSLVKDLVAEFAQHLIWSKEYHPKVMRRLEAVEEAIRLGRN